MNVYPTLQLLAEKFIKTHCETFPLESTYYGLTEYYPLLQYPGKAQIESYTAFLKDISTAVEALSGLNGLDTVDQHVLQVIIDLERFMVKTVPYEGSAVNPAQIILGGIYSIIELRIPDEEKMELIISRLQCGLSLFESCYPTWEKATITDVEGIPVIQTVGNTLTGMLTPFMENYDKKSIIKELIEDIDEKGKEFAHWLEDDIKPQTTESCRVLGKENYKMLLRIRKEDHTWEERLEMGKTSLQRSKTRLKALAQKMVPEGTVKAALEKVRSIPVENYVKAARTAHENVVTFLKDNDLLQLPEYPFQIVEPPDWDPYFSEGMVGANMAEILRDEPLLQITIAPPQTEKGRKELNKSFILLGAAHEGAAGHLGSFILRKKRNNLIRMLIPLTTGIDDGWTFYWEQLLREKGIDPTIEYEFFQEYRVFWCSLRHICDVSLHCGLMSFKECVTFLEKEGDVSPLTAKGYVKLIAVMPGYFSSFIVGKAQLLHLREYTREQLGHKYSLGLFHKWIGEAGPIPHVLMKQEIKERIQRHW